MPRILIHSFTVPKAAIDVNGHVNNIEYMRWMQDVATRHSAAQGWTLEQYLKAGAGWVVRSHYIEYLRPAFEGDPVTILTWVAGFSQRSSPRKYLFVRESDRQILAEAETVWVFVDFRTGRPCRILDEVQSAFEVVADDDEMLQAVRRGPGGSGENGQYA
jgi:acyl-CoA thioester hydrolase